MGAAWLVGTSEDPPSLVLSLGESHVLAVKVKDGPTNKPRTPEVCASFRTLKHMRADEPEEVMKDP